MIVKENKILGRRLTLFRDRYDKIALGLAALRTSDQDVLRTLLIIYRDHLEERSASPQNTTNVQHSQFRWRD